ncbi:hypothetical protein RLOatenuis_8490 [Rickettsiales bacterium]|nr:hypothetical protein RLOatenuis_8490 [Rickettsiales bacterium]
MQSCSANIKPSLEKIIERGAIEDKQGRLKPIGNEIRKGPKAVDSYFDKISPREVIKQIDEFCAKNLEKECKALLLPVLVHNDKSVS